MKRDPYDYHWLPSERDRLRAKAQAAVWYAVRAGKLPKLSVCFCMDCGKRAECYDHRDYRKPLDVVAVCKGCNNRRGPGLPLPKLGDNGGVKKPREILGLRDADGAGYMLEAATVHLELDWAQLECDHDDAQQRYTNLSTDKAARNLARAREFKFRTGESKRKTQHFQKGERLFLGVPGFLRYEYFKSHEPWSLS